MRNPERVQHLQVKILLNVLHTNYQKYLSQRSPTQNKKNHSSCDFWQVLLVIAETKLLTVQDASLRLYLHGYFLTAGQGFQRLLR